MAEANTNIAKQWRIFGYSLILFAGLVLLNTLWDVRVNRSASLDVPLITGLFAIVAGMALLPVLLSTGLIISGKLKALINPVRFWVWFVLSASALILLNSLASSFTVYIMPFVFWIVIFDIGLLLVAYSKQLAILDTGTILRNLGAITFGIVITLLMLELLLRVYFGVLGTERQRVMYVYPIDKVLELSNRYQGLPYVNYGLTTTHPEHNSRGYRGAEFDTPKPDGIYRIFTTGGSTTYGEGIHPEESYPALLQEILHEDYGYTHVEVVNAGVNAYSSFDSFANLIYHIMDDEPDMLIVYHGVNDVRARLVAPDYYSGANLQRGYWNPYILDKSLSPSVLIRFVMVQLGLSANLNQFENVLGTRGTIPRCGLFEEICPTVGNRPASEIIDDNPPVYFERNLINMNAITLVNDVDIVFSTWQYYPGELELPNPMTLVHMQDAVDEQNDLIRDLGIELNIPVMDLAFYETLSSPQHWIDGMHLTPSGTRLQAEFYARYLVENNLLPPPSEN